MQVGESVRDLAEDFSWLLKFANHPRPDRPWGEMFATLHGAPGAKLVRVTTPSRELAQQYTIHGDPFSDEAADELQQGIRQVLDGLTRGQHPSSSVPYAEVKLRCWWLNGHIRLEVDSPDLAHLFAWLTVDLARQHKDRLLHRCEDCSRFVLAHRPTKAHYCSSRCRKRAARDRRRIQNQDHSRRYRKITSQTAARQGR